MLGILFSVVTFTLVIFALVDLIVTESWAVKHLPKLAWVLIILILPLIGSIIWLLVGKDRVMPEGIVNLGRPRQGAVPTEASAPPLRHDLSSSADDDEARVEAEIAFYENQARIRRLEEKLRAEREGRSER